MMLSVNWNVGSSTMRAASKPFCHCPLALGFCWVPNLNSPYMPNLIPSMGDGKRPNSSLPGVDGREPSGIATMPVGLTVGAGGVPATPVGGVPAGAGGAAGAATGAAAGGEAGLLCCSS